MPVNKDTEPKVTEMPRGDAPTEPVKQDLPEVKSQEDEKPQSYVWLADGSVVRCYDEDLPIASGTNAQFGHWQRGNKVYQVVGVYPVEHTLSEESK